VTEFRTIFVKHNAEIAHRLSQLPGKCQQIHGHSLQFTIELRVAVDENGIARTGEGGFQLDFAYVKSVVRRYIDEQFDHHLLLNAEDPLVYRPEIPNQEGTLLNPETYYPGLVTMPGDPTIENIAMWVGQYLVDVINPKGIEIRIDETNTNGATWSTNRSR